MRTLYIITEKELGVCPRSDKMFFLGTNKFNSFFFLWNDNVRYRYLYNIKKIICRNIILKYELIDLYNSTITYNNSHKIKLFKYTIIFC